MLTELTPAHFAAVPLAEFAEHLRLSAGFDGEADEVAALDVYARAATAAIEGMTGKALIARRFRWTVSSWRDGRATLPLAPVGFVAAVTLVAADGGWEAADPSRYVLIHGPFAPCLTGPRGADLPAIPPDGHAEIEFEAGYGADWNAVPPDLRQAVMMLGAHYHEQRHVSPDPRREAPYGVRMIVQRRREVRL